MFRQVVSFRWAEGVTDEAKAAFRVAFAGLQAIPELSSMRFADDAQYFDGNFDAVAVMDFPDFTAARRYVADDRHQAYVRDFASKMIGERVVVQHDWAMRDLAGVHHVTLPVSHVARSRDWYARAFGLTMLDEATDDGEAEVTMAHPSAPIEIVLRQDPLRAQVLAGFTVVAFTLATTEDLDAFVARLDTQGVAHGPPTAARHGLSVDVTDPDELVVQLRTLLP